MNKNTNSSGNSSDHTFRVHRRLTSQSLFVSLIIISMMLAAPLSIALATIMIPQKAFAQTITRNGNPLAQNTFPPPIFTKLRDQPSYVINIPPHNNSATAASSIFNPMSISIPVGMTVIWFNNDAANHAVATIANSTYSPPESFSSGAILGVTAGLGGAESPLLTGGSFVHKFTKPGVYLYTDNLNPPLSGGAAPAIAKISVGNATELGKNMNMMIGGENTIPINQTNPSRFVVSFVPTTVSLPPTIAMTYNVTILNSNGKVVSRIFDDRDGILDLELVPTATTSASNVSQPQTMGGATTPQMPQSFIVTGPDFEGQAGGYSTGTFHIQGPIFNGANGNNNNWTIMVSIVSKDNTAFNPPLTDTFVLPFSSTSSNANMTTTTLPNATASR